MILEPDPTFDVYLQGPIPGVSNVEIVAGSVNKEIPASPSNSPGSYIFF